MEHGESAAWPLACGVLCAFVLAVVLKDAAWQVGFTAALACVAGWGLSASPLAGAALGLAAWAFVTGFDVHKSGELALTGVEDVARAAPLVAVGVVAATAGRWLTGSPGSRIEDDLVPAPEDRALAGPVPGPRDATSERWIPIPGPLPLAKVMGAGCSRALRHPTTPDLTIPDPTTPDPTTPEHPTKENDHE